MPSWSIHLAIAKRVNKELKLNKNIFYYANLLPDVNYNMKIHRHDSHFKYKICKSCPFELLPDIDLFLKEYRNNINNPLIMGYYVHLLTDYFYNNYTFSNKWILNNNKELIGIKLNDKELNTNDKDHSLRKKYKQGDLILYGKYLFNNNCVSFPKYDKSIKKDLNLLKDNFITISDVKKRIDFLNSKEFIKYNKINIITKLIGYKYKLFKKDELNNLFEECIKFILDNIENNI